MDSPGLVSFPLPLLTALLCLGLSWRVWRLELGATRASRLLAGVFALGAVQASLVALRFGYGIEGLFPVQRALPLFLGPLLYLGFAALAVTRAELRRRLALHLIAPVILLVLGLALGRAGLRALPMMDLVIGASYLVYIVLLWRIWRRGPDGLIQARVELSPRLPAWILRAILLLGFLLVIDSLIAMDFALNGGENAGQLISLATLPLLVVQVVALAALPRIVTPQEVPTPASEPQKAGHGAEALARLDALLTDEALYRDPELSLQRLARRLHLPAREVSGAVNRLRGMNMSQYINAFRIDAAADRLLNSRDSVKAIAEEVGFLARSNFYREFQRVYGVSPTVYRETGGAATPKAG